MSVGHIDEMAQKRYLDILAYRLLYRLVYTLMSTKLASLAESKATRVTLIGLFTRMSVHMFLKILFGREVFRAHSALVLVRVSVYYIYVSLQVLAT